MFHAFGVPVLAQEVFIDEHTRMAHESSATFMSWLGIIMVLGLVLGALVLLVVGLSNRHTRGATKAVAGILASLFVVAAMGMWYLRASQTEATVWRDSRVQPEILTEQSTSYPIQTVNEWEPTAPASASSRSSHTRVDMSVGLISPVVAIVFLGIVFLLFKYCGPTVGLAGIAVPLLFLGFGYFSLQGSREWTSSSSTHTEASGQFHGPGEANLATSATASLGSAKNSNTPDLAQAGEIESGEVQVATPLVDRSQLGPDVPDWVRNPPKSTENLYRTVVETGWWPDEQTCRQQTDEVLLIAVAHWLSDIHREAVGRNSSVDYEALLSPDYIRNELVSSEYVATRDFTHQDGMKNLYLQIEIPDSKKQQVVRQWRNAVRGEQTAAVAMGMGSVLACLAGVLGLIKLDTYTKGYYSKRLFIGVPLAIIGGTLMLGLFAKLL